MDRFGRAFSGGAIVKGYTYVKAAKIEVVEASERGLDANVRGQRVRRVSIVPSGPTLAAACTCGATSLGPPSCPHVFAALLECDRRELFVGLRAARGPLELLVAAIPDEEAAPKETKAPKDTKDANETRPSKEAKEAKPARRAREAKADQPARKTNGAASPSSRSPRANAPPPATRGKPQRRPRRP